MDNTKIVERMREYMCAHYPNCHDCPLDSAARKLKMKCTEFRRRRPDEAEFIVRTWKYENSPARDN